MVVAAAFLQRQQEADHSAARRRPESVPRAYVPILYAIQYNGENQQQVLQFIHHVSSSRYAVDFGDDPSSPSILIKDGVRVGVFYEGAYIFTTADSSLDVLDRRMFEHLYAPYINTNISSLTHPPCTTSR